MATRTIKLDGEQAKRLAALAEIRGVSVDSLVREAIAAWLAESERRRKEQKTRALAVVGQFASDGSDISTEHDRYLDEAFSD